MKFSSASTIALALSILVLPACHESEQPEQAHEEGHEEGHQIVVTTPVVKDVVSTQQYVCQIHSRRHIEVCALESGYLQEIKVKEGQTVKQGDVLFNVLPTLYQAKFESEMAEARLAQIEFENTTSLFNQHVVSNKEVALAKAKLDKAQAQVMLAQAELNFTEVKSPFAGIIDRLHKQQGSLIEEGDVLTSLSDNAVMWVYFNVPEARYLEYMAGLDGQTATAGNTAGQSGDLQLELVLANGNKFEHAGTIGAIEGEFNNETGNIAFRADFPNPHGLLRHGQTGSVLIHRVVQNAVVIPQRSTFEVLDKHYVYVVTKDDEVHQAEIQIEQEMEDIFVLKSGIQATDRIVLEGIREVHEGEKVEYEFRTPAVVMNALKHTAE